MSITVQERIDGHSSAVGGASNVDRNCPVISTRGDPAACGAVVAPSLVSYAFSIALLLLLVSLAAGQTAEPAAPAAKDAAEKKSDSPATESGAATMTPQERLRQYIQLNQQVAEFFKDRKYEEAAAVCVQIIDLAPRRPDGYYNLACAQARLGKTEDALANLKKAIECGYGEAAHMQADEDLESLHKDPRFAALVKQAEENADSGTAFPFDKGAAMADAKTIEDVVKGGLRYRLRMDPKVTKDKPARLIVWLHPSGGYANNAAEALVPLFFKNGYALVVFTQKNPLGWSEEDLKRVRKTLDELRKIEGLDVRRPILMGFSAGGQAALMMWAEKCGDFGGLILDAAYPVDAQSSAAGQPKAMNVPADETVKKVPIFVAVGGQDGGSRIWTQVKDAWLKAGVPLEVHVVPERKHEWLLNRAEAKDSLARWLADVAAGKFPADKPAAEPKPVDESHPDVL